MMTTGRPIQNIAILVGIGLLLAAMPIAILLIGRDLWTLDVPAVKRQGSSPHEHLVGEFHESNHSLPGPPLVVDLTLYADVEPKETETYQSLVEGNEHRLQSAVSGVIRSVPIADLREPTLTTLKRKMKVALVEATGGNTRIFDSLLIPDFDARQIN